MMRKFAIVVSLLALVSGTALAAEGSVSGDSPPPATATTAPATTAATPPAPPLPPPAAPPSAGDADDSGDGLSPAALRQLQELLGPDVQLVVEDGAGTRVAASRQPLANDLNEAVAQRRPRRSSWFRGWVRIGTVALVGAIGMGVWFDHAVRTKQATPGDHTRAAGKWIQENGPLIPEALSNGGNSFVETFSRGPKNTEAAPSAQTATQPQPEPAANPATQAQTMPADVKAPSGAPAAPSGISSKRQGWNATRPSQSGRPQRVRPTSTPSVKKSAFAPTKARNNARAPRTR